MSPVIIDHEDDLKDEDSLKNDNVLDNEVDPKNTNNLKN